jgi:electron transfer flavoprotein alpha subunit
MERRDSVLYVEVEDDGIGVDPALLSAQRRPHPGIVAMRENIVMGGGSFSILVLGSGAQKAAAELTGFGAAKIIACDDPSLARYTAEHYAPTIAEVGKGYALLVATATTFGKDLMPRVAALLGAPQVSDIMAVESATCFKRPIYAGNAITTVEVAAGTKIVATIRIASFEAAAGGGSAQIESVTPKTALPAHTRFVSLEAAGGDRPDLQSASKVISGGRALASTDAFKLIYSLADKIGAAVGASRAAVDAGYVPSDMQVGQTG